jgi:hypothetical protein
MILLLLIPLAVALITAGPAWWSTNQTRKENKRDHSTVLQAVVDLKTETTVLATKVVLNTEATEDLEKSVSELSGRIAVAEYRLDSEGLVP